MSQNVHVLICGGTYLFSDYNINAFQSCYQGTWEIELVTKGKFRTVDVGWP